MHLFPLMFLFLEGTLQILAKSQRAWLEKAFWKIEKTPCSKRTETPLARGFIYKIISPTKEHPDWVYILIPLRNHL